MSSNVKLCSINTLKKGEKKTHTRGENKIKNIKLKEKQTEGRS